MCLKEYVTWGDVESFKSMVCQYVREHNLKLTGVYGLPRGGLVPAVMLSHELDIPFLGSPAKGCLIVDDICDTGESLLHYAKNSSDAQTENNYVIATIYYKENMLDVKPDLYLRQKYDAWIVFPWEKY